MPFRISDASAHETPIAKATFDVEMASPKPARFLVDQVPYISLSPLNTATIFFKPLVCGLLRPSRKLVRARRQIPVSFSSVESGSFLSAGRVFVSHSSRRGS